VTAAALRRSRKLTPDFITDKCDYFVDVQLWPRHPKLNPSAWLSNFDEAEKEHAAHLLNGFLYLTSEVVDTCLAATIRGLSRQVGQPLLVAPSDLKVKWDEFCSQVILTFPTDEDPNPTDSGPEYIRRARHNLGLSEAHYLEPQAALQHLLTNPNAPIIFVDDFVGTGNQFIQTWRRPYRIGGGFRSFADTVGADARIFYTPILCTETGMQQINGECPAVVLEPTHLLGSRYSVFSDDSIIWPSEMKPSGREFVLQASKRAGIPDSGGVQTDDCRGFANLGLAVAIGESVPDATIPLFYWETNGWRPLIRRR
jgi:hypothetical protein